MTNLKLIYGTFVSVKVLHKLDLKVSIILIKIKFRYLQRYANTTSDFYYYNVL